MEWSEHLSWGAYAYWTLWFSEIFAALLLLLEKAKAQQVLRPAMVLPFVLFALFMVYSIAYQYVEWVTWAEMTAVTACPTGMAVPVGGLQEMTEPETTVSE